MKIIKTLFFILISLKLNAQDVVSSQSETISFSKPKWDVHLAIGGVQHKDFMIGLQGSLNGRFKNHLYASVSYMGASEFLISIPELFPSSKPADELKNLSIVTGAHYSEKYFYGALGVGLGKSKGNYWDVPTKTQKGFQTYGLEIKVQTSVVFWKYIGLGLTCNYNRLVVS